MRNKFLQMNVAVVMLLPFLRTTYNFFALNIQSFGYFKFVCGAFPIRKKNIVMFKLLGKF